MENSLVLKKIVDELLDILHLGWDDVVKFEYAQIPSGSVLVEMKGNVIYFYTPIANGWMIRKWEV